VKSELFETLITSSLQQETFLKEDCESLLPTSQQFFGIEDIPQRLYVTE
jgi:hypothetical protein